MTYHIALDVAGVSIAIDGDRQLFDIVSRRLAPWVRPNGEQEPAIRFFIHRTHQLHLQLRRNGSILAEEKDLPEFLDALQQEIEGVIVNLPGGLAVVHAGVVAVGGKAILFPGRSGSGKTSLVRELVCRGAEYFSDEFALIDPAGMVHPFVRPLMVRQHDGSRQAVLPHELGAAGGVQPRTAGLILALAYRPESQFEIHEMHQSAALLSLLENTPQTIVEKPEILTAFRAASRGASSFQGVRGDAGQAAAQILALATRE